MLMRYTHLRAEDLAGRSEGRIIETQRIFLRFDRISPIIVIILVVVILIEQFSVWIRKKIL